MTLDWLRRGTLVLGYILSTAATGIASEGAPTIPPGTDLGAGLTLEHATEVGDVAKHPERYTGKPILLRGRVSEVASAMAGEGISSRSRAAARPLLG